MIIFFVTGSSFNNSEGLSNHNKYKRFEIHVRCDCSKSQTEIIKFIESCKKNEDEEGNVRAKQDSRYC